MKNRKIPCPHCGASSLSKSRFCIKCGKPLHTDTPQPDATVATKKNVSDATPIQPKPERKKGRFYNRTVLVLVLLIILVTAAGVLGVVLG